MRRLLAIAGVMALAATFVQPSVAHAQQSLNFHFGGFVPRGEDGRVRDAGRSDDVLVNNLDFLAFNINDFSGGTIGLEYAVGLGDFLEGGLGVGYYKRTVPSVYADFVNDNGFEIEQDLRLRIVPMTATIRLLPLGRSNGIEPYIGAGIGIFNWRYGESGEFVDFADGSLFRERFVGSGTATGPVILGGVRIPLGPWAFGGEVRYQKAEGELPVDQGFSADKIDLGGMTYTAHFSIRF